MRLIKSVDDENCQLPRTQYVLFCYLIIIEPDAAAASNNDRDLVLSLSVLVDDDATLVYSHHNVNATGLAPRRRRCRVEHGVQIRELVIVREYRETDSNAMLRSLIPFRDSTATLANHPPTRQ